MEPTNATNSIPKTPCPSLILVVGGTGYIGSHTCVALSKAGHDILILDNLCNSHADVVDRLEIICGKRPGFIRGDVRDTALLDRLFAEHVIHAVFHFAGLKAVGESVDKPLEYYDNNVHGTLQLLAAMRRANVKTFVFSSSATVYGDPASIPIRENFPRSATNPYGRSKLIIEDILTDLHRAEPEWRIALLRYFNPIGAHESGLIGESPQGIPNNLMPFVAQVATGKREFLNIFGNDYPTKDGTGIRDYIHVVDLAEGHVAALNHITHSTPVSKMKTGQNASSETLLTVNLGTGYGYSVFDLVKAFEKASGRSIPYKIAPRRPGDISQCLADPSLAYEIMGWKASRGLDQMCADGWRWQQYYHRNEDGEI